MASTPRRFLLLPEESVDVPSQGPRIRRYRLSSVARRSVLDGAERSTPRIGGGPADAGRMCD